MAPFICGHKFFLYVSRDEQKKRFPRTLLKNPDKNWKFSHLNCKRMKVLEGVYGRLEELIRRTATKNSRGR
jgi:polyphosphate kinase 2 (PPK2 family)